MTHESARRAGDALHTAAEQASSAAGPVRLPAPTPDADLRAEHGHWLRRRGLQRQLHDGAALRISALALRLGIVGHRVALSDPELRESIDDMQNELHAALQELRDVTTKIYPQLLDEAGLGPALQEVAYRIATPVRVEATDVRFGPAVEAAAYFAVTACLDVLDESTVDDGAAPVEVLVCRDADGLAVHVCGVDVRHGLLMNDQVRRMGGTIDVLGGPGVGTIIVRVPCE